MGSDEVTRPSAAKAPAPTPSVDRYVLGERLGEGAMGVVWKARDTQLDRDVALKLLHDRLLGGDHQARLVREARTLARLSHPNVVAVYDAGEHKGRAFVAMELVRGQPLSTWLETPRTWQDVVAVFRQVADGLAAAHAAGVVHRDVKPSNILIGDDGRARLVDFGIAHASTAHLLAPEAPLVATTAGVIGSPAYMSIQRLLGEPADASGDQFSYCVALYEALHGKRPFDAPTIAATITAITRGLPPPIREVPRWLHAVVVRGLALEPGDRFASMVALNAALAGPRRNRVRTVVLAALATVTIGAVATAIAWPRDDRAADAVHDATIADATSTEAVVAGPDAAAEVPADAAPTDAAPADAAPRVPPRVVTTPPLSKDERLARMKELRAQWTAAFGEKDYAKARRAAEAAMALSPEHPDPPTVATTSSCYLGEQRRARALFAAIPRGSGHSRMAAAKVCRRLGISLDDLLTESELRHSQ